MRFLSKVTIALVGTCLVVSTGPGAQAQFRPVPPAPYACNLNLPPFPNGMCKPNPTEPNIPTDVRWALYNICLATSGNDGYVKSAAGGCCDHVTQQMKAEAHLQCGSASSAPDWGTIFNNLQQYAPYIIQGVATILSAS